MNLDKRSRVGQLRKHGAALAVLSAASMIWLTGCIAFPGGGSATNTPVATITLAQTLPPVETETPMATETMVVTETATLLPTETATEIPSETPTLVVSETAAATGVATGTGAPTSLPTGAITAFPTFDMTVTPAGSEDPKTALLRALNNVYSGGPYRFTMKSTANGASNSVQTNGEVVLPDRFHVFLDGQEVIIVGSNTYLKSNGTWVKYPVDAASMLGSVLGPLSGPLSSGMSNITRVGADTVNGAPATVYQYDLNATVNGQPANSQVKVWIDDTKDLPVRQVLDGNFLGSDATTTIDITYDSSITIEDPGQ